MDDIKIVEQISSFKKIPLGSDAWRLAFYHIAREFWNMGEHFIVLDKASYEQNGYHLPLIREYKGSVAVQFFTNYEKARIFVEDNKDLFEVAGKKLIYKIKQGAFQQVFAPFFAQQKFNYIINAPEEHFLDTFERLIGLMEADSDYIVDEFQKSLLDEGNYKEFFVDICKKYLVFVG
ncbi:MULTISPECIES: hypothetical protein [unclassified Gemella]|uniref:hypothetical protein n=1 Tax=unclassified Gemella TaxID=2624949 RepID=UPI00207B5DAC|nr:MULTISPECIES: hypothetical protein [unclassified Gemella]